MGTSDLFRWEKGTVSGQRPPKYLYGPNGPPKYLGGLWPLKVAFPNGKGVNEFSFSHYMATLTVLCIPLIDNHYWRFDNASGLFSVSKYDY